MGKVGGGVGEVDRRMFAGDFGDVVKADLGRLLMERLFKFFLEQVVDPSCFRLQSVGAVLDLFFIGWISMTLLGVRDLASTWFISLTKSYPILSIWPFSNIKS